MQTIDRAQYLTIPRATSRRLLVVARLLLLRVLAQPTDNLTRFRAALLAAVEALTSGYLRRHLETFGGTPTEDVDLDMFVDGLWVVFRDRMDHWAVFRRVGATRLATLQEAGGFDYAARGEEAKHAREVRERLIGLGSIDFTKLKFPEQAEYMRTLWSVIEQENYADAIKDYIGVDFFEALRDSQGHYLAMVDRRVERERGSAVDLRALTADLRTAMQNYVLALLVMLENDDQENVAMIRDALRPIDALREQAQRERGGRALEAAEAFDEDEGVAELLAEELAFEAELNNADELAAPAQA